MLAFLHTAQVHVATFDALVRDLDSTLEVHHAVCPELLEQARRLGVRHAAVATSVSAQIRILENTGAKLVVCTCSTIGGVAEAHPSPQCSVLRIDRPMAEHAVNSGRRLLVAAALESTFEPTLQLLRLVAQEQSREPVIERLPCYDAWPLFECGDLEGYAHSVAGTIEASSRPGDCVVLAQASMAPAAELVSARDVEVLSSPRLGVETALLRHTALD